MTRQARTAVTMLTLVVLLVAAGYLGWVGLTQGWTDDEGATAEEAPAPSCSTPEAVTVRARQVRVSVYNAGAPAGQATAVMEALADQGFTEGEVTDAPDRVDVDGIVIRRGRADRDEARLVRRQFRDARMARRGKALGPGVNVLVGETFDGLARRAPRAIEVPQDQVCEPSG